MSKYTPGPWEVRECTHGGGLLIRGNDRNHPQSMLQIVPMADARLIAAAPELLEALRALVRDIQYCVDNGIFKQQDVDRTPSMIAARAAIAKAEGV